jgi:hypothetical protein
MHFHRQLSFQMLEQWSRPLLGLSFETKSELLVADRGPLMTEAGWGELLYEN